jgi:hypothetical protein
MFARGKNREKRRGHAGMVRSNRYGVRTTARVFRAVHADAGQEIGFPMLIRGDGADFLQDFMDSSASVAKDQHRIQFARISRQFCCSSPAHGNKLDS